MVRERRKNQEINRSVRILASRSRSFASSSKRTLTVSKDDNGMYEILLDVTNKYTNNYTSNGGNNTRIVVNYKGTFEKY